MTQRKFTMNTSKYFKSKSYGRRLLFFLMALFLASGLVFTQAPEPALAWPPAPIDDERDPITPPPFTPPANGFTWSVPSRYGLDRNFDRVVDDNFIASTFNYDMNYIYPGNWPVDFYGCQTAADAESEVSTTNTYRWSINGQVISGGACTLHYTGFIHQGTYPVTLTYIPQNGTSVSFSQQVYIKDYFIVVIGDSLASGEGNPDIPSPLDANGNPTQPPVWQNKRCHRSANAYPSKAAMALENSDPHTSVTFISYACSGASIQTLQWDVIGVRYNFPNELIIDLNLDPSKYRGTGIFGHYIGNETTNYDQFTYIPAQMQQLQSALTTPPGKDKRRFDSLIMAAGGNDLHFGDIAAACLFGQNCWPGAVVPETPNTGYDMQQLVWRALTPHALGGAETSLPDSYARLDGAIDNLDPKPAKIYITQYADQTRADTYGSYCDMLYDISASYGYYNAGVTSSEAQLASTNIVSGMNLALKEAAGLYGWQLVDGISSYEVDPAKTPGTPGKFVKDENNKGHGYCASDNWIVRAAQSEKIQGPYPNKRLETKGTLHPNGKGHQALKDRLLYYMLPNLGLSSLSTLPAFSTAPTGQGLTNTPGTNGWYTGSCDSYRNCFPQVVLQAVAKGAIPLKGVGVSINGAPGCTLPEVTCSTTLVAPEEVQWDFTFTAEGIYQILLSAKDSDDRITDYEYEIKVDLKDPVFDPLPGPFEVDEGGQTTLSAQASDSNGATLDFDWDLNNDGDFETKDEQPVFSAADLDGPTSRTVGVRVTDEASRLATATATINVNNLAPVLSISAPVYAELYTVNAEVNLNASVTDAGTADTLTCSVDWADGTTAPVTCASGSFTASHAYSEAGVYIIQVTAKDDDLVSDTEPVMVVVYDPTAGFVTGGGWIDSPAGAYKADETLAGKATFGFVSKYQKGANIPTGNTAFEFDLAGLAFSSQSYDWLVVNQAGTIAQFKGTGLINGAADPNGNAYKFMLWAGDGSPDTFRIRIWWEDAAGEHDVYDNSTTQAIGAGNIVVHTGR
jgi:hypothetical protein